MKFYIACICCFIVTKSATAQDTANRGKRTIDITSSFKPQLRTPDKIAFAASPASTDSARRVQPYRTNVQSLALAYQPASLRPLAYEADTLAHTNNIFIKVGYGNFSAPYLRAIAGFGAGKPVNGSVYGNVHGGKGKLDYQEFGTFNAGAQVSAAAGTSHLAEGGININGINTYRYGYGEKAIKPDGDSLKVKYTDVSLFGKIGNSAINEAGINYNGMLTIQHFADNASGKETGAEGELRLLKTVGERFGVSLGLQGRFSNFKNDDTSFKNNFFMLPVGLSIRVSDVLTVKGGIIPSWNNNEFALLPDFEATYAKPNTPFIFEAGLRGRITTVSYRSLALQNWWIAPPTNGLNNTRTNELFGAMKSTAGNNFSWRAAASLAKMQNVPLFINDNVDGKSFLIRMEEELSRLSLTGELKYQFANNITWSGVAEINGYSGQKTYDKPYGLLPFMLKSGVEVYVLKAVRIHGDVYTINGVWARTPQGENKRLKSAVDLNAGLDFGITSKLKAWVGMNNIFNQAYQRWNQYPVLGFQVLGGVILNL